jgi:hypothetical protein
MLRRILPLIALVAVSAGVAAGVGVPWSNAPALPGLSAPGAGGYEALTRLFAEWRAFQRPPLVDGVPDYGSAAMARQYRELAAWKARLEAIDVRGWPVPHQVDWHIVRAEMNGLDFDHRVLRPWANNPAFYATVFPSQSDQPAREGPLSFGAIELWSYTFPLSTADAATITSGLRIIPAAAGVRHQLPCREDANRGTAGGPAPPAGPCVHAPLLHGRTRGRRPDPDVARPLGADGPEAGNVTSPTSGGETLATRS